MKILLFWSLLVGVNIVTVCQAAKILVVFPVPAHSHHTLGFALAKALAQKGHQVTFVNPYHQKRPIENLREVDVEGLIEMVNEHKKELFAMEKVNPIAGLININQMMLDAAEMALKSPSFGKLLKSKQEKFDLVLIEYFMNDAMLGLGPHFGAPTVALVPTSASVLSNHLSANPAPASYVANPGSPFTKNMSFFQRTANLFMNCMALLIRTFVMMPRHKIIYDDIFKDSPISFEEATKNVSLILTNSHISVNDAVPHVPNQIEVGGFHVETPKPLPKELQVYLDSSPEGVVLFSMGSNLKSKDLKPEVKNAVLKSLSKIKQKVLWKFEAELEGLPDNVKIMKWLPQNDILAHKNIKAFISHGGLLSTIETIYHGVPVIGIPVFGDQKGNIAKAVANGYGLSIPLPEVSEEKLSWALNEILSNPKYTENAKRRSRVMHDRPIKPLDSAIYWIEYVIRNGGALELRNSGMDLNWAQLNLIDVFLFVTLTVLTALTIIYVAVKKLLSLCFGGKKTKIDKKKKKQ